MRMCMSNCVCVCVCVCVERYFVRLSVARDETSNWRKKESHYIDSSIILSFHHSPTLSFHEPMSPGCSSSLPPTKSARVRLEMKARNEK